MRFRARFQDGVLKPDSPLPFREGEVVELDTVPDLREWIGVLPNPEGQSSVDAQHEAGEAWAEKYVPR
jgi:predicted DNA-binding antitoxin AbrB/MazE fold protein